MPGGEGAGGELEGQGSGEGELASAEVVRGGKERRRAVGDGDPEALHRRRRREDGGGVVQVQEAGGVFRVIMLLF
jgi:hypothetical protein